MLADFSIAVEWLVLNIVSIIKLIKTSEKCLSTFLSKNNRYSKLHVKSPHMNPKNFSKRGRYQGHVAPYFFGVKC